MITTAETYKKKGIEQYRARQYEDAIASFDQAITLGDRSVFIYDMKITSMIKVDMRLLEPGHKEYQARALHAVEAIIKKFEKNQEVWKLHYRKADILYRRSDLTLSLVALKTALESIEKLPTKPRLQAREVILTLRNQVSETILQRNTKAMKDRRDAVVFEAAQRAHEARLAEKKRTNWYATAFPAEILVIICKFGMESDGALNRRMAGVCKAWEGVVLGEKMLWQDLSLGRRHPVKKAALWAKHCQGSLREVVFSPSFDIGRWNEVSSILDPFLDSIQSLEIRPGVPHLPALWKHRFSRLSSLKVCDLSAEPDQQSLDFGLCKPGTTTLRSLEVRDGTFRLPTLQPPPPVSNNPSTSELDACAASTDVTDSYAATKRLVSLRLLDCVILYACEKRLGRRSLLVFMPNIEDVDFYRVNFLNRIPRNAPLSLSEERVTLPRLRRYKEDGIPREDVGGLFSQEIDAPELRELDIAGHGIQPFDQLLSPGFYPDRLVSLDLSKITLRTNEAVDFLRHTTSLRFLNVSACGLGDPFLQAMEHQDGLDDQLLPALEALSMCVSDISGGAVRDFVNSRLPFEERMPSLLAKHYNKPKAKNAFRPTSSRSGAQAKPLISLAPPPSQTTKDLDETIFSTQPGVPSVRPRIKWLCVDECQGIDPVYITLLKKHVKYVSWWLGSPNLERQKGMGRWDWDGEIEACVDSPDGRCHMRQVVVGKWTVVHNCQKLVLMEEGDEKKDKGWSRLCVET